MLENRRGYLRGTTVGGMEAGPRKEKERHSTYSRGDEFESFLKYLNVLRDCEEGENQLSLCVLAMKAALDLGSDGEAEKDLKGENQLSLCVLAMKAVLDLGSDGEAEKDLKDVNFQDFISGADSISAEEKDDKGLSPMVEAFLCWICVRFLRPSHPSIKISLGKSISVIYITYSLFVPPLCFRY
nr:TPR repeat-containing protein ZIP4 [Tanacetum cinerariifolium]